MLYDTIGNVKSDPFKGLEQGLVIIQRKSVCHSSQIIRHGPFNPVLFYPAVVLGRQQVGPLQVGFKQLAQDMLGLDPHLVHLVVTVELLFQKLLQGHVLLLNLGAEMNQYPVDPTQVIQTVDVVLLDIGPGGLADIGDLHAD